MGVLNSSYLDYESQKLKLFSESNFAESKKKILHNIDIAFNKLGNLKEFEYLQEYLRYNAMYNTFIKKNTINLL